MKPQLVPVFSMMLTWLHCWLINCHAQTVNTFANLPVYAAFFTGSLASVEIAVWLYFGFYICKLVVQNPTLQDFWQFFNQKYPHLSSVVLHIFLCARRQPSFIAESLFTIFAFWPSAIHFLELQINQVCSFSSLGEIFREIFFKSGKIYIVLGWVLAYRNWFIQKSVMWPQNCRYSQGIYFPRSTPDSYFESIFESHLALKATKFNQTKEVVFLSQY